MLSYLQVHFFVKALQVDHAYASWSTVRQCSDYKLQWPSTGMRFETLIWWNSFVYLPLCFITQINSVLEWVGIQSFVHTATLRCHKIIDHNPSYKFSIHRPDPASWIWRIEAFLSLPIQQGKDHGYSHISRPTSHSRTLHLSKTYQMLQKNQLQQMMGSRKWGECRSPLGHNSLWLRWTGPTIHRIIILLDLLNRLPEVKMEHIHRDLNDFTDNLASYARSNPGLSLFHRGMDLPHWITNAAEQVALCF